MQSVKLQEQIIAHSCRNVQESLPDASMDQVADTEQGENANLSQASDHACPPTTSLKDNKTEELMSAEDMIDKVGREHKLNEKQWMAFRIIAWCFVCRFVLGLDTDSDPL